MNTNECVTAFLKGQSDERQQAMERMAIKLTSGERVVVGTMECLPVGSAVGWSTSGRLRVKRRSTRAEFLEVAPVGANVAAAFRAPFYWELELEMKG